MHIYPTNNFFKTKQLTTFKAIISTPAIFMKRSGDIPIKCLHALSVVVFFSMLNELFNKLTN